MGATITPVSGYRNSQYDISILIWKVNSREYSYSLIYKKKPSLSIMDFIILPMMFLTIVMSQVFGFSETYRILTNRMRHDMWKIPDACV